MHPNQSIFLCSVNSVPYDKFVDPTKIKAFAETFLDIVFRAQNIMGNGESANYKHFLLFLHCFQKSSFVKVIKLVIYR